MTGVSGAGESVTVKLAREVPALPSAIVTSLTARLGETTVSMSVAELLERLRSAAVGGAVTVAVLVSVPLTDGETEHDDV